MQDDGPPTLSDSLDTEFGRIVVGWGPGCCWGGLAWEWQSAGQWMLWRLFGFLSVIRVKASALNREDSDAPAYEELGWEIG